MKRCRERKREKGGERRHTLGYKTYAKEKQGGGWGKLGDGRNE